MSIIHKWWSKLKNRPTPGPEPCQPVQEDNITLELPLLKITLSRKLNIDVPHEVSIIIPRAEIRCSGETTEFVYSSITVVHAPRHPLAGEMPPGIPGETNSQAPAIKVNFRKGTDAPISI